MPVGFSSERGSRVSLDVFGFFAGSAAALPESTSAGDASSSVGGAGEAATAAGLSSSVMVW